MEGAGKLLRMLVKIERTSSNTAGPSPPVSVQPPSAPLVDLQPLPVTPMYPPPARPQPMPAPLVIRNRRQPRPICRPDPSRRSTRQLCQL